MNNFLVSISCITYNHAPFIRACLDGFLMQKTSFPFEIIIHDDASTDGTKEIIEEYVTKYPDIIFPMFQEENQYSKGVRGMMAKFNFPRSKGKYIALCEGDDYWTDPLKLQKQVDFLDANEGYSGCFHYTQTIQENGELGKMYGDHKNKLDFDAESTFSKLSLFHTSSFVFLKSALELPIWLSKVVSGDMAIFSIIAAKGNLKCLPEVMSIYRKHSGGVTNSPDVINNFHSQRIELMMYLNDFHNYKYQNAAIDVIYHHKMAIETTKLANDKLRKIRKNFWILNALKCRLKKIFRK